MKRSRGRPRHDDVLTPAEWRTLHGVRHGFTNAQIATRTGISRDAVKYHVANIVAKLDVADRRALKLWRGYPKSHPFLAREDEPMAPEVSLNNVGQIARRVKEIDKSTAFYRDVVGLPLLYEFDKLAFFDMNGLRLMLEEASKVENESVIYFTVDDIDASYEALSDRGASFVSAPHLIHRHEDGVEEWMAFFEDPEARLLGLMSRRVASVN